MFEVVTQNVRLSGLTLAAVALTAAWLFLHSRRRRKGHEDIDDEEPSVDKSSRRNHVVEGKKKTKNNFKFNCLRIFYATQTGTAKVETVSNHVSMVSIITDQEKIGDDDDNNSGSGGGGGGSGHDDHDDIHYHVIFKIICLLYNY